eukprot:9776154-Ditylum_brightwellii.AAC.1
MMGILLDGAANVFCDNDAVVKNTSMLESTLKKKHISICYYMVHEAVAANILWDLRRGICLAGSCIKSKVQLGQAISHHM